MIICIIFVSVNKTKVLMIQGINVEKGKDRNADMQPLVSSRQQY